MNSLYDTIDMSWTHEGLLKVVRKGNGYEWMVFGVDNLEQPLFKGYRGSFFDAQHEGEMRLEKDLKQIFWLLSEMSTKERKEGEPKDAELIEQTIRQLNAGDAPKAVVFLDRAIRAEHREREPEDVAMLMQARNLILAQKEVTKDTQGEPMDSAGNSGEGGSNEEVFGELHDEEEEKSMRKLLVALAKAKSPKHSGHTSEYCAQCKRTFDGPVGHNVHDGKVHSYFCENSKAKPKTADKRPSDLQSTPIRHAKPKQDSD